MDFFNIRIFFSKTGNAKYISHLDLYRAMGRAIKRAQLPVWFTEGFNPHIYMTFALPLALGIEGADEPFDLRLTEETALSEVTDRLNAVMPQGLQINRTAFPVRKAADIEKARYEAETPDIAKITEFLSRDTVIIEKKTKSKTIETDIKPHTEFSAENDLLTITLPAGNTFSVNPLRVFSGFEVVNIKRTAILCGNGALFN
jgi:radical SAM-linked protein